MLEEVDPRLKRGLSGRELLAKLAPLPLTGPCAACAKCACPSACAGIRV